MGELRSIEIIDEVSSRTLSIAEVQVKEEVSLESMACCSYNLTLNKLLNAQMNEKVEVYEDANRQIGGNLVRRGLPSKHSSC